MEKLNNAIHRYAPPLRSRATTPPVEPITDKHQAIIVPSVTPPSPTTCSICHGAGYTVVREPMPSWKSRLEPCKCRQEEIQKLRQEFLIQKSGVLNSRGATFQTFNIVSGVNPAVMAAHEFAECPFGILVFVGVPGCGKTHLAQAIAHERIAAGDLVSFQTVPDLLDELKSSFDPKNPETYEQIFHEIKTAPIAVFDDYGTQAATAWSNEKMFQLLNYRYMMCLPTIITTNVSPNLYDERIKSRLKDRSKVRMIIMDRALDYRLELPPMD